MNDMLVKIIYAIIEMFCMFSVGALAMRLKFIEKEDLSKLGRLVIDIMFPMLAFSSITSKFDPSQLNELWLLPVFGFALMFSGGILGFAFRYGMRNRSDERMITFHHFCAINNYVFLPLIILQSLWGDKYVALLLIMNIGSTLGFWTVGVGILSGGCIKRTLKNIFSINLLAVVLALSFCFLKIPVPEIAANVFSKIGGAAVPLMLIVIGAAIWNSAHHLLKNKWDIIYLSLVRLIVIPLILVSILKLLPLPLEVFRVVFVVSIMPVSSSAVVFMRRFGGNPDLAAQAAVVTTLLSILTIPIMTYLFL
ncbi:MAG: AEC family transporter [Victivallaceae bacterium]|nr:AEC family transporter [Victivallaceae bacterium]